MTLHEIVIKRVKWTTMDLCIGLTPSELGLMYSTEGMATLELNKIDEVIPQVACSRFKKHRVLGKWGISCKFDHH